MILHELANIDPIVYATAVTMMGHGMISARRRQQARARAMQRHPSARRS